MVDGTTTQSTTDAEGDEGSKETPKAEEITKDEAEAANPLLAQVTSTVERLEAANKVFSDNLNKQEQLAAFSAMGGRSIGGQMDKPKTEDEKDQEDADAFLKEEE